MLASSPPSMLCTTFDYASANFFCVELIGGERVIWCFISFWMWVSSNISPSYWDSHVKMDSHIIIATVYF